MELSVNRWRVFIANNLNVNTFCVPTPFSQSSSVYVFSRYRKDAHYYSIIQHDNRLFKSTWLIRISTRWEVKISFGTHVIFATVLYEIHILSSQKYLSFISLYINNIYTKTLVKLFSIWYNQHGWSYIDQNGFLFQYFLCIIIHSSLCVIRSIVFLSFILWKNK